MRTVCTPLGRTSWRRRRPPTSRERWVEVSYVCEISSLRINSPYHHLSALLFSLASFVDALFYTVRDICFFLDHGHGGIAEYRRKVRLQHFSSAACSLLFCPFHFLLLYHLLLVFFYYLRLLFCAHLLCFCAPPLFLSAPFISSTQPPDLLFCFPALVLSAMRLSSALLLV